MTRYDDDASDVRAALGPLLSDAPASGWTVQDDVARGRAYQRQRRTRWGAGMGIVAAAALVVGLVGPLRPSAPAMPVLGEVPTVEGVPQAWFDSIGPALIDSNVLGVPDWDRSSVSGSAAAGFRADLVLVPVSVTTSGEQRTVELVPGDGLTGRLTLEWFPGRTEPGPALQLCTKDVCPNQGATSFIGGPVDQAATAGKGAPFPEGTIIVDRQYPQGLLEMVNYASAPPSPAGDWTVMLGGLIGSQFLSELGDPVLGPPAPPPGPEYLEAQRAIVEPYLATRGYRITDALIRTSLSIDGRVGVDYTVTPTDGDGSLTASLFVTAYPTTIVADPYPSGSYLAYCTQDVCTDVAVTERDCADPATCPTTFAATTTSKDYVIGSGLQIALLRYDDGTWMEVVSSALECLLACDPTTVEPDAFLTRDQTVGLASALGRPEFTTTPTPLPTASGTPTPSPTDPTARYDAVVALLESYGFRVTDSGELPTQGGGVSTVYNVDVDRTADNPRTAILSVTSYPAAGVPVGATSIDVPFTVLAGCTGSTCTPVEPINVPCPSTACFQFWTATTTSAYEGVGAGSRAMLRSDGGDGVEAVAGPVQCDTCASPPSPAPFLTIEQTQQVLQAYRAPSAPAGTPCTAGMVKLVPATDPTGGATGERSVAIEVYARNPQISCVLDGLPAVDLQSAAGGARRLNYTEGLYQRGPQRGTAVTVDADRAAVFVVAKSRCGTSPVEVVDQVNVQLPGDRTVTGVALPAGFGLELCGGAGADASTVWVSAFSVREGGVG